ncbi:hypothetical protein EDC94DRAFT_696533 [Helicostylum pulchrum]|nr:hypothetical protein EDC94DRAFT_696533 [Helicostylum pulchrum]
MKGYYQNWRQQSPFIPQTLKWYHVNDMMIYLHRMRSHIFERSNIPNLLSCDAPVAENYRFPKDTSYMCEGIGNWNIYLDKLLLCLSILKNSKRMQESDFKTIGQVELFALEMINHLLQSIAQTENLLTCQTFEEMYKIVWIENIIFVDYQSLPVVVASILQRVDKLWHTVAQYK